MIVLIDILISSILLIIKCTCLQINLFHDLLTIFFRFLIRRKKCVCHFQIFLKIIRFVR